MTFRKLGLSTDILRAVTEQGYTEPTPIQQQAIPAILQGQDVLASAQTGTGKTAGFTLPLLHRLSASGSHSNRRAPRALILAPTRELAAQVGDSVKTYGKYLALRAAVIFGGVAIEPQTQTLRRGVDIVVATPGRLLDHLTQKNLDLSHIEVLVLDECDRMLDMGFIHDIRKVLAKLPASRQTLMFSATFSPEIQHLVDRDRKRELLSHMIGFHNWQQVLVFTRTKHGANRLAEQLAKDGLKATAIHGNKTQAARTRALSDFKQGKVRVLVATDVASRGLDIDQLPYVVNYELPNVPEDYVHRIGRTGRAGNAGRAVSLVCKDEYPYLKSIERLLNRTFTKDAVPGYEPTASDAAQAGAANQKRSGRGNSQAKSEVSAIPKSPKQNPTRGTRDRKQLRTG
jgi:ATP-dependent RNA helicase RhlE